MVGRVLVAQYKKAKRKLSAIIEFHAKHDEYPDGICYRTYAPIIIRIDLLAPRGNIPSELDRLSQDEITECCYFGIQTYNRSLSKFSETYNFCLLYQHHRYSVNNLLRSFDLNNVEIILHDFIPLAIKHVSCHTIKITDYECIDIISMLDNVSNIKIYEGLYQISDPIDLLDDLVEIVKIKKIPISYQIRSLTYQSKMHEICQLYESNIKSIRIANRDLIIMLCC